MNALDVDRESTPAQCMVGQRQDVARHLVAKGCRTDLLMTAAIGDLARTRQHLDADPSCIAMRVGGDWFPMANPKAGGTIHNWTLDSHASAHEVANRFGQHEGTPLHWAAFHGNADMVREVLRFNPPLETTDRDFKATPLGWAMYGSEQGWCVSSGRHAEVVEALLQAGAKRPDTIGGTAAVRDVLQRP